MKPIQVEREIFRYEQGAFKHIEDSIVTEFPVTIKMNGQEFVTMVRLYRRYGNRLPSI